MKIFFDVDGVIIDGWHAKPERRKHWDTSLKEDLGISREGLRRALFLPPEQGAESVITACARGERDLKEVLAGLLPALGYAGPVEAFLEYWFRKDSNLNQGVLKIVKRLRQCEGVELYLATNQEKHRAAHLWNGLGLKAYFDDIFYSGALGVLKDDIRFFSKIDARLGRESSEPPLFFDDTEKAVMTPARPVGMLTSSIGLKTWTETRACAGFLGTR